MRRGGIKELMKELGKNVLHISGFFVYLPTFSLQKVVVVLMAKGSFWLGAFAGFFLIVRIADALPVLGPIICGHVAGLVAKRGQLERYQSRIYCRHF